MVRFKVQKGKVDRISKHKKIENNKKPTLFDKITFLIAICAAVVTIVLFITGPDAEMRGDINLINQKIEQIENNHLPSLEKKLDGNIEKQEEDRKQINNIRVDVARILEILEK